MVSETSELSKKKVPDIAKLDNAFEELEATFDQHSEYLEPIISPREELSKEEEGVARLLDDDKKVNYSKVKDWFSQLDPYHQIEFLIWKKEMMGSNVVAGFEDHDLKYYEGFESQLGEVYEALTKDPVEVGRDTDGYAAAKHHIGALEGHDIIEDGLEEVEEYSSIPPIIREEAKKNEREDVPKLYNSLWDDHVKHHFFNMAWNLGFSREKALRFSEENTEFYRRHTGVHEDSDNVWDEKIPQGSQDKTMQKRIYEYYAVEAQKTLISGIADLEREDSKVQELAIEFLEVVDSHDAHTLEDQLDNVKRMKNYYRNLISEVLS